MALNVTQISSSATKTAVNAVASLTQNWTSPDDGGIFGLLLDNIDTLATDLTRVDFWLNWLSGVLLTVEFPNNSQSNSTNNNQTTNQNTKISNRYYTWIVLLCLWSLLAPLAGLLWFLPTTIVTHDKCRINCYSCSSKTCRDIRAIGTGTGLQKYKMSIKNLLNNMYSKVSCLCVTTKGSRPGTIANLCTRRPCLRSHRTMEVLLVAICILFLALLGTLIAHLDVDSSLDTSLHKSFRPAADDLLNVTSDYLAHFIPRGNATTLQVLNNLTDNVKMQVDVAVLNFTNLLLTNMTIVPLFATVDLVSDHLDIVSTALNSIYSTQESTFKAYSQLKGTVESTRDNIVQLMPQVCSDANLNSDQRKTCIYIQMIFVNLSCPININNVNLDSSKNLLFLTNDLNVNLTSLLSSFYNARRTIDTQLTDIYAKTNAELNLDSFIHSTNQLWVSLTNTIQPTAVSTAIGNIDLGPQVDNIDEIRRGILIAAYVVIFLYLFLSFLLSIQLGLVIWIRKLFKPSSKLRQSWSLSADGNHSFDMYKLHFSKLKWLLITRLCLYWRNPSRTSLVFEISLILASLLLVVAFIVAIVCFLVGCVVQSEACYHINTVEGMQALDSRIDFIIDEYWSNFTASLLANSSISLPQPSGVLQGFLIKCNPSNVSPASSLIQAFHMEGILNADDLVHGDMMNKMLETGKILARDGITKADLGNMFPSDAATQFSNAVEIANYFDNNEYQPSIDELSKPAVSSIIPFTDLTQLFVSFTNGLLVTKPDSSNYKILANYAHDLSNTVPEYQSVSIRLKQLLSRFQVLEANRNISVGLSSLSNQYEVTRGNLLGTSLLMATLDSIYDQVTIKLKTDLEQSFSSSIDVLESQLFPCQEMSRSSVLLLTSLCSYPSSVSWMVSASSLALSWPLLTAQISLPFLWMSTRRIRAAFKDVNVSCV